MSGAGLVLASLNLAFIAVLPAVFFKRGSFNLAWFATAAPYALCAASLVAGELGALRVWTSGLSAAALGLAAVLLHAGSILLIGLTLGTHRRRLALWHQADDAPQEIVTYGAYRLIRHPFYAAFLLALVGAFLASPSACTAACLAYGLAVMNHTAAKEESKLAASAFGAEYRRYVERTGRFVPRLAAVLGEGA